MVRRGGAIEVTAQPTGRPDQTRLDDRLRCPRRPSLLHTGVARAAFPQFGLQPVAAWPKYSPDLNPQENVWSWVEHALRREERMSDTFAVFTRKLLRVSKRYPSAATLIPSMHKRMKEVLSCKGGMTKF